MVLDVVCGMEIDEKTAKWKSEYKGKTCYFCRPMCKLEFDETPPKYMPVDNSKLDKWTRNTSLYLGLLSHKHLNNYQFNTYFSWFCVSKFLRNQAMSPLVTPPLCLLNYSKKTVYYSIYEGRITPLLILIVHSVHDGYFRLCLSRLITVPKSCQPEKEVWGWHIHLRGVQIH